VGRRFGCLRLLEGVSWVAPAVARSIGPAGWALRPEFVLSAFTAMLPLAVLALRRAGNPLLHL
jgi:hypothetical protein